MMVAVWDAAVIVTWALRMEPLGRPVGSVLRVRVLGSPAAVTVPLLELRCSQGALEVAVQGRSPLPVLVMLTEEVCRAVVPTGTSQPTWLGPALRVGPGRSRLSSTTTVTVVVAVRPLLLVACRVMTSVPTGRLSNESSGPVPRTLDRLSFQVRPEAATVLSWASRAMPLKLTSW